MFKGIFVTTNPVPIKALVEMIGIKAGNVRLPLVNATPEEISFLKDLLMRIKKTNIGDNTASGMHAASEKKVASNSAGDVVV